MKNFTAIARFFILCSVLLAPCLAFSGKKATEKRVPEADEAPAADSRSKVPAHPNAVSLEILGRGGLYSINYDRMISDSTALGGGFSYWSTSNSGITVSALIIPVYANYYFSPNESRAFATGGFDLAIATVKNSNGIGHGLGSITGTGVAAVLGGGFEYRGSSGFLFRAAPYLLIGAGGVAITAGLGFGATF